MTKKLWGGRFSKKTDRLVEEFTKSIHFDHRLAKYDLISSILHVLVLKRADYLTSHEAARLTKALQDILKSVNKKRFKFDPACEDIHTNIQNLLNKKVGNLVLKLQTARSRNEQVSFATKLFCKEAMDNIVFKIDMLAGELLILSLLDKNRTILPGFTHLQHAQPVFLGSYLMAYYHMLKRDEEKLKLIADNIKLTMGAGALAGTPILPDKYKLSKNDVLKAIGKEALGILSFEVRNTKNSLDSVSDRDFVIELLSALSITAMHVSRLAEDLIIWSTKEFDFIEIGDPFCTGSSLMPQKKNPDVLELIRGYTGRAYGNLMNVLTVMKGLPLSYNRDMQLDKEPLFDSIDIIGKEAVILSKLIKSIKFKEDNIDKHLKDEALYATDLVYYLIKKGLVFKEAHTVIGQLIKYSLNRSVEIKSMSENQLKKFSPHFVKKEILRIFDPKISVESRKSTGMTKLDKIELKKTIARCKRFKT